MVTDGQVRVLRRKLMEGKTQEAAAAGAGMSVRSARKWQAGPYPSQAHKPHLWRTRADPLGGLFESEIAPLLAADEKRVLEARTLLGELDRRHPGCFSGRQLRSAGYESGARCTDRSKRFTFPRSIHPGARQPSTSPTATIWA